MEPIDMKRVGAVGWAALFLLGSTVFCSEPRDVRHLVVRHEAGQFFGWPANGGIWNWGDEILVQYKQGTFKDKPVGSHDVDGDQPIVWAQSRSKDGGLTWTHESTDIVVTEPMGRSEDFDRKSVAALASPLDFTDPDLALKFEWMGNLYYSRNRGQDWTGPFSIPDFGYSAPAFRTDYLVGGPLSVSAWVSLGHSEERRSGDKLLPHWREEVYRIRTRDGGLNWSLEGRVGRSVGGFESGLRIDSAIMPSTVKTDEGDWVTCIRNLEAYPKKGWIECWGSRDEGRSWKLLSIPVDEEAGTTPPSLSKLEGGRLVLTYGYRKPLRGPTSIRARISLDNGNSWSDEIVLRTNGGDEDIGYTRDAIRPDGKVVTIYYWNDHEKTERYIAATLWNPGSL